MTTNTQLGWLVFIAAFGMLLGLMSVEVANLHQWVEATTPEFIGKLMAHIAAVVAAFIGGRLIPTKSDKES